MLGYTFEIQYYRGSSNKVTYALSQRESVTELNALSTTQFWEYEELATKASQDDKLKLIIQDLLLQPASRPNYSIRHRCLLYKGMLVLPKSSKLYPSWLKNSIVHQVEAILGFFVHTKELLEFYSEKGSNKMSNNLWVLVESANRINICP